MSTAPFVTVPMNHVRVGEYFTPIEKRGEPVFNRRSKRWEKKWAICPESFVSVGRCHGRAADGRDALFALSDWAIVRRDDRVKFNSRADKVVDKAVTALLRKFAR